MKNHADKSNGNQSRPAANQPSQKKEGGRAPFSFVDNRPEAKQLARIQEMMNKSPQAKKAAQLQAIIDYSPRMVAQRQQLDQMFGNAAQRQKACEEKELLQALARTQGVDIHVGPGQEKHLPHEASHPVQQSQGRVKPTLQAKGASINDDEGVEHEAEVQGRKAARGGSVSGLDTTSRASDSAELPMKSSNIAHMPVQMTLQREDTQLQGMSKENVEALNMVKNSRLFDPKIDERFNLDRLSESRNWIRIRSFASPNLTFWWDYEEGQYFDWKGSPIEGAEVRDLIRRNCSELGGAGAAVAAAAPAPVPTSRGGGSSRRGPRKRRRKELEISERFKKPEGYSTADIEMLMATAGADRDAERSRETKKRRTTEAFDVTPVRRAGVLIKFGGPGGSAADHVTKYVKNLGFPAGLEEMRDLKDDLVTAVLYANSVGTLGKKGRGGRVPVLGAAGTWYLIIKKYAETLEIEHADLNDYWGKDRRRT